MAINTLKNIKKIGDFEICHLENKVSKEEYDKIKKYININHEENTITFKIQKKGVKENGVNGCQVDDIIMTSKLIIEGLNKEYPCMENGIVITKLEESLRWLNERKESRQIRNVEGKSIK